MIELIGQPACLRSKKIKQWLRDKEIPFEESSLYSIMLDEKKLDSLIRTYAIDDLCDASAIAPYLLDSLDLFKEITQKAQETAAKDTQSQESRQEKGGKSPSSARLRQMRRDLVRIRKFLQANPSLMRRPILLISRPKTVQDREKLALIEQMAHRPNLIDECRNHCPTCLLCHSVRSEPDYPVIILTANEPENQPDDRTEMKMDAQLNDREDA